MRTRGDKRPGRKHDRKVLVAEESTKSWADTDSESSSSSSSSSDSEQEEVHCLMADQTSDDEVFDFTNVEFTREYLVSALNDMVKEYMKLSHSFEEAKAENISLKNSSIESSSDELEDIDSLKIELKMSTWNQSARALHKLHEIQKSVHDRTGLGFNSSDSSEGETSTQSQPAYDKFNKMSFVKANVIYDCFESITFDDQNSPKLNDNGKAGIGFQRPENSKPSWLKNKLDKDK
ncbi:125 kDa kinesin-related protein [Dorcoceras hygrometricum]|uniref:125 kDa kinesin-related protein n=1 Tax=Dorcoceras hygrometricum TaxID=472368 RepID=A0A2Z7BRH5_9LAMI|nr:125 kDa kinesin-related protein [Dorcoceras hygrometricum]